MTTHDIAEILRHAPADELERRKLYHIIHFMRLLDREGGRMPLGISPLDRVEPLDDDD